MGRFKLGDLVKLSVPRSFDHQELVGVVLEAYELQEPNWGFQECKVDFDGDIRYVLSIHLELLNDTGINGLA
jgi:hypothetical protein